MNDEVQRALSEDTPGTRLSSEDRDFHRREVLRLRALAKTITTPAVRARVLAQAEEHARLIGLAENAGGSE